MISPYRCSTCHYHNIAHREHCPIESGDDELRQWAYAVSEVCGLLCHQDCNFVGAKRGKARPRKPKTTSEKP
jgi:hypothetical protein